MTPDLGQYHLEILDQLSSIAPEEWNQLNGLDAGPFTKYEFLSTLEETGCVGANTGWQIAHLILRKDGLLVAAMPHYIKQHSYGEFVFDWSWAQAYEQHGMRYFPKALCAIPFTPVPGSRILIAPDEDIDQIHKTMIQGLKTVVNHNNLSSAHVLFPAERELQALKQNGFMLRDSVQFHWHNAGYSSFEQFLSALTMKRRKNIRRERDLVAKEKISFRHIPGQSSDAQDWAFFYRCYQNTYLQHHSMPYLSEDFFKLWAKRMPDNLYLIFAQREEIPIAASLLVVDHKASKAFGRYWGAVEYVPNLHFETAYYQAIEYCILQGIQTFEGGAQGEHKLARGFLPTPLQSAHYIADPKFAQAIKFFLQREQQGIGTYVDELNEHNPLKSTKVQI
jgi:uncharacterized protein